MSSHTDTLTQSILFHPMVDMFLPVMYYQSPIIISEGLGAVSLRACEQCKACKMPEVTSPPMTVRAVAMQD